MGKCVKLGRLLTYLRTPYDERLDTIPVSEIFRRVQAIREKAAFHRFYPSHGLSFPSHRDSTQHQQRYNDDKLQSHL